MECISVEWWLRSLAALESSSDAFRHDSLQIQPTRHHHLPRRVSTAGDSRGCHNLSPRCQSRQSVVDRQRDVESSREAAGWRLFHVCPRHHYGSFDMELMDHCRNVNRSAARGISNPIGLQTPDQQHPPAPPIDHQALLKHEDKHWTYFHIPYNPKGMNKCLSNIIFSMEKEPCADKSITQMWIGLSNPEQHWTMDMLPIGCDMYVPSLENFYESDRNIQGFAKQSLNWAEHGMTEQHSETEWHQPRWYTTVNMTVDVKRTLPKEGVKWLFTRMKTNEAVDGRLDVQGQIWDDRGNLIALAQYVWFVVETSRAVVTRAAKESSEKKSKL